MMMKTETFLVTAKPIGKFFFGGEFTFNPSENITRFFSLSEQFPQQTTLLGAVRYLILKNNVDPEKSGRPDLIGEASFDPEKKEKQSFGIIQRLGPVFLTDPKGVFWYPAPLVVGYAGSEKSTIRINLGDDSKKEWTSFYHLGGFSAKTGLNSLLINGNGQTLPVDSVFIPDERVGRNGDSEADDKGFYLQRNWRLQEGWSFAWLTELSHDPKEKLNLANLGSLPMGADNSRFLFKLIPQNHTFDQIIANWASVLKSVLIPLNSPGLVVLLSPAVVTKPVTGYSVSEIIRFRSLFGKAGKKQTYQLKNVSGSTETVLVKQELKFLYNRGSVFWGIEGSEFNNSNWQSIGYNYFITL